MLKKNQEVIDFLLSRRSRPAKTLKTPSPSRSEIQTILTAASRTPDHGKLEPWRFIVLERAALDRLGTLARRRGGDLGLEPEKLDKIADMFTNAPLSVAVVSSPKPSEKIPEIEQILSAGAVCLALLNSALASGWGANWLTGWTAFDRPFLATGLGLSDTEFVAGFIHIGTETSVPPDRPRPDVNAITSWVTQ